MKTQLLSALDPQTPKIAAAIRFFFHTFIKMPPIIHFIFKTVILSVDSPVTLPTASTMASRTDALSAPWHTMTAPR